MAEDLRVVQLEDKVGNPIAPFTLAESVTLSNGRDVQEQVEYMDIDNIHTEEVEALAAIGDAIENAVEDIQDAGSTYRTEINQLSGSVETLDSYVFPLTISYSITPDFVQRPYTNTIRLDISEYQGSDPILTSSSVQKSVNGSEPKYIYNPLLNPAHVNITDIIEGMKEDFIFNAETSTKSDTKRCTRYLCFYGATNASAMTSSVAMGLTKILTTTVSFNPTIKTTYGQYIWLIVPNYLSINSVKSSGFDVTFNPPEYLNIGGYGTYKAYRTINALDDATCSLVIS